MGITAGVAALLLVVGFEAPTWASNRAATTKIGTSQIKNHSVTTPKIATGAVTTPKIATGAVTSDQVLDGSLTASDVAPNTFLPSNGTAADSDKLGGQPASDFVQGAGGLSFEQVDASPGQIPQILSFPFGKITGSCASGHPVFNFVDTESPINVISTTVSFGGATAISSANGLTPGTQLTGTNTTTAPQTATYQIRFLGGSRPQVVTAWLSGQDIGGNCLFLGQALSSG